MTPTKKKLCTCNERPYFPGKVHARVGQYERIISFMPGFICEQPVGTPKSHGIHGMDMLWLLKNRKGAVNFILYTQWMPDWDMYQDPRPNMPYSCRTPLPADIGYHSPRPLHDYQKKDPGTYCRDDCPWLDGKPCYYDGSSLNAIDAFKVLLRKGEEALWKYLEDYHRSTFEEGD